MFVVLTDCNGSEIRINVQRLDSYLPRFEGGSTLALSGREVAVTESVQEIDTILSGIYLTVKKKS